MKSLLKYWFSCVLAFLLFGNVKATHIVGGEIYYNYLGGNSYDVTIDIYRDCNGTYFDGYPGYLVPNLGLWIYDGNFNLIDSIAVEYPGEAQVPAGLNYVCYQPPAGICVNRAVYNTTINLPLNNTGYILSYERCCRNGTIVNISNPGQVGSTYTIFVPPRTTTPVNNSPRYKNFPPIFICANVPLVFDHSATDPDGDSLVYSLCDAFLGADACCPFFAIGTAAAGCGSPCSTRPDPPPYSTVPYVSPYSGSYPMSASPAISVDPVTGLMTGTPNMLGQWVVAVCVSEYRNGVLISVNKRDFQFNVVNCTSNIVAAIPTQTLFCRGYTVNFGNNSVNASSYFWDFGVPGLTNDTSILATPTYTFPDSGVYTVTLIANPGLPCSDTAYETVRVYPLLAPDFDEPSDQCIAGNSFNFNATGVFTSDATFSWNFGSNASPSYSSSQSPTSVTFDTSGVFNVILIVSQYGCSYPVPGQVEVIPLPKAMPSVPPSYCGGNSISFETVGLNTDTYSWNFGDPLSANNSSTLSNPTHVYSDTGYFNVTVVATNSVCRDTDSVVVHVIPGLLSDFSTPLKQCFDGNSFNFQAGGSYYLPEANFNWDFSSSGFPSTSSDQSPTGVTFNQPGIFPVELRINQRGCSDSIVRLVEVVGMPVAAIAPQPPYCGGFNFDFDNSSTTADSYSWNFGRPGLFNDTSSAVNPSYTYSDTGFFNVTLIAVNDGMCYDTTVQQVHVFPKLVPLFTPPSSQCFEGNSFSFSAEGVFQQGAQVEWNFGSFATPATATGTSVSNVVFTSAGTQQVMLKMSQYGCSDSIVKELIVIDQPVAVIDSQEVFCSGYTMQFGNSSQFSDAWSWDFGVTQILTDTSSFYEPTYTYPDSGTYQVRLIASSQGVCFDTAYRAFQVYPLLLPEIVIADNEQCLEGNSFTFSIGGAFSPRTSFLWLFGPLADPDSSILRNPPPVTFNGPGDYVITLEGVENGCNKSVEEVVHVYPEPVIDFDISSASGCSPLEVHFSDRSIAATNIFYTWSFGDGTSSSERDPVQTYPEAGVYDVSLTIRTDSGCVDTLSAISNGAVTVHQTPVAGFILDSLNYLELDPTIVITDQSQFGDNCIVHVGNGEEFGTCSFTYTYPDTGTYKVIQIVTTSEGCSDTAEVLVRVPPTFRFYIPNAFTPNGDGVNDEFKPFVFGATDLTFDIWDRWGEKIFEGNLSQGWDGTYNGRSVQEDVYVYRVSVTDVFGKTHKYTGRVTVVK